MGQRTIADEEVFISWVKSFLIRTLVPIRNLVFGTVPIFNLKLMNSTEKWRLFFSLNGIRFLDCGLINPVIPDFFNVFFSSKFSLYFKVLTLTFTITFSSFNWSYIKFTYSKFLGKTFLIFPLYFLISSHLSLNACINWNSSLIVFHSDHPNLVVLFSQD